MAKTVTATALEAFEWNGRSFSPGESIPALPVVDALVLMRKRAIHVPLTRKAKPAEDAPPVPKMPVSRSRRRYRRSDMHAETPKSPAPAPPEPPAPIEPEPSEPEPFLTQDLTPDDEES